MEHKHLNRLVLELALGFIASSLVYWMLDDTSSLVQANISSQVTHVITLLVAAVALWGISNQIQSNMDLVEKKSYCKT